MIYLDDRADTFPVGLRGTPFEPVYKAVRSVAAQVWATDPEIYRAGMAWGWYATHKPDALAAFRDVVVSALISAQAPMIKATQTNAELVEYLRQWREYRPTFPRLQSLYTLFGAVVDIQPISDPESQAVLPVDNTRLAFYLRVESVDPERPLSLPDAITIAVRATPMGSRPYAYYVQESRVTVPVALAPAGVTLWVENDTVASDPPPLPVYGIPMGGMMSPTGHSTYYVQELPEQITVDNITLSGLMIPSSSLEEYFGNDQLEPESITINNDDVIISLYDFDVPVTDTSKLYGVMRLNGTGTGDVPTPTPVASFNNLDTLRQMGLVSLIYNGNHQLCLKFSCAGTGITFTGSMDSALIIAAIKQQMTVDNIGLMGMVGPMGGMMTEYVPPPALPTVSVRGDYSSSNWIYVKSDQSVASLAANESLDTYYYDTSQPMPSHYDTNKSYAVIQWQKTAGTTAGRIECAFENNSGALAIKNVSSATISIKQARVAVCSSNLATVITVYDSSNNPYNAFKYTLNGTDYYYVLDGTQTDWTDDLSSIGYHLPAQTLELVVWVSDSDQPQLFGANDYWYSRIGSESDVQALIDFGGEVITDGQYKYIKVLNTFFYDLVDMYGATGNPIPSADFNNFWLAKGRNNHSGSLYIRSRQAYSTGIKTWKVRITENKDNVSWMMSDQSDVFIGYAGSHQLYDSSGNTIPYDSTKTYTIVGYYTGASYVSLDKLTTSNNQYFSFINYNSSGYLGIKSSNNSTDYLIQRVIYKVE